MDEPRSWKPREVIDRKSADDVRYWSARFGVAKDELLAVIAEKGPRIAALATEFGCVVEPAALRRD
jgi:hypothetical protein